MNKYLLLLSLLGIGLASCSKTDDQRPAITTDFDQDFSLHHKQEAQLSTATNPELTLTLADLQYSICPPNANCAAPDLVSPTLRIADAAGQAQQLTLPLTRIRQSNQNWVDTTYVRANGRRYLLTYRNWALTGANAPNSSEAYPGKANVAVVLRVARAN